MNRWRFAAAAFFSFLAFGAYAEGMVDLFPGTLVIYQDNPVLIRCDLVKNAYVLVDRNMEKETFIRQIEELQGSIESPVSASVYGTYKEVEGVNHLVVREIDRIHKGSSCHLVPPKEPLNTGFK